MVALAGAAVCFLILGALRGETRFVVNNPATRRSLFVVAVLAGFIAVGSLVVAMTRP